MNLNLRQIFYHVHSVGLIGIMYGILVYVLVYTVYIYIFFFLPLSIFFTKM